MAMDCNHTCISELKTMVNLGCALGRGSRNGGKILKKTKVKLIGLEGLYDDK